MPEQHRVRFGSLVQAVNVYSSVALDGEGNNAGSIPIPGGTTRIKELRVAMGNSAPVATDAGVAMTIRLNGAGLRYGTQDFAVVGATTNLETTGAGGFVAFGTPAISIPCNLEVTTNNFVDISAAFRGVDVGTPEVCVEVVFE